MLFFKTKLFRRFLRKKLHLLLKPLCYLPRTREAFNPAGPPPITAQSNIIPSSPLVYFYLFLFIHFSTKLLTITTGYLLSRAHFIFRCRTFIMILNPLCDTNNLLLTSFVNIFHMSVV